jgi:DNA-binding response OmpR family regulator
MISPQSNDRSASSPLRVLVVEDEMMVAFLVETMLGELGHQLAGWASRLEQAMDLARSTAADLAILDINLDGEPVYPVADVLAERGIPFLFATGYGRQAGQSPYADRPTLQKPYRLDDLRAAIAAVRRAHGQGR